MIALCLLVALAAQIGECALDACGECVGHRSMARHEATPIASGACHNCICIGTTSLEPSAVQPPLVATFAVVQMRDGVGEAHPSEPFLPPRFRA